MLRTFRTILLAGLLTTGGAEAADQVETTGNPEREVKVGGLNERTYKSLTKIHESVGEELYDEAFQDAKNLYDRVKGNAFEEANLLQTLGHISSAREQYDVAIDYFKQAVAVNALPNRTHFDMYFGIAQLEILQERYAEGLKTWDDWSKVTDQIKPDAYVLKASAHAQQEQYKPALAAILKAINLSDSPKEGWYNLALAAHFELKQYSEAIDVLQILVRSWPSKKKYWTQLTSLQLQQKRDKQALATLALAHRKGMLDKQADFLQLFNLYGFMKVPYKAGSVLAEGLEKDIVEPTKANYEQLASAWFAAKEFDRAVLAYKEAAKMATDGKVDQQIAYIESERENWNNVSEAAASAVEKGGLNETDQGNMYLLMGMARWELNNADGAKAAFNQAKKFDKTRRGANEWLALIDERLAAAAAKAEAQQAAASSGQ